MFQPSIICNSFFRSSRLDNWSTTETSRVVWIMTPSPDVLMNFEGRATSSIDRTCALDWRVKYRVSTRLRQFGNKTKLDRILSSSIMTEVDKTSIRSSMDIPAVLGTTYLFWTATFPYRNCSLTLGFSPRFFWPLSVTRSLDTSSSIDVGLFSQLVSHVLGFYFS